MNRASLVRYAWLSIGAAVTTIGLKAFAYLVSGSVGLLSDAMESGVNLVAAIVALGALAVAARPPDEQHHYGHEKAEYFSSGVEGALILFAAVGIAYTAIERLLNPRPLEQAGLGLVVSVTASLVNLAVARILLRVGNEQHSITLEADAHHLMTDVWTSIGVVLGVGAVALTHLDWLDPAIALLVAANIVRSGVKLLRRSVSGLMDSAISLRENQIILEVLNDYRQQGIRWHGLRTRQSGPRGFMTVHVLVPGNWTIQTGHDLAEQLEQRIRQAIKDMDVTIHIEPLNDAVDGADSALSGSQGVS